MADNTIFNDFTNKAPVPMVMFISGGGVYRPANSTDFVGAGGGTPQVQLTGVNLVGITGSVTTVGGGGYPQVQLTGTNVIGITGNLPNVTIANPISQVQLTGTNTVTVGNPTTQVLLTGTNTVTVSNPVNQVQLTGTNVMGITGSLPNVTIANPTSQVQLTGINQVGVSGVATVNQQQGGAATLTAVSGSASNVSLVSSNASRKGLLIYNNSLNNMYTKLGTTASITGFSFVVASSGFYEMPINYYTGQVSAIWSAAGGSGIVTEVI